MNFLIIILMNYSLLSMVLYIFLTHLNRLIMCLALDLNKVYLLLWASFLMISLFFSLLFYIVISRDYLVSLWELGIYFFIFFYKKSIHSFYDCLLFFISLNYFVRFEIFQFLSIDQCLKMKLFLSSFY